MSSPPTSDSSSSGASDGADSRVEPVPRIKKTLPPPEWSAPKSVSGLALDWLTRQQPAARRKGPTAALHQLRAGIALAAKHGDGEAERVATARLARHLITAGVEFDSATKLARRSLMLGEDPMLREELSSWFAGLGEAALAAATLEPLVHRAEGTQLGRVLTRIAVFLGRTGNARQAAEALARAAEADPRDPVSAELHGAIGAWAPRSVSASDGADRYLEGFRRREAIGDKAGAFEDLLRAFDMAPESTVTAQRLAAGLGSRGRVNAADEVLRECAASGTPERAAAIHRDRMRDAVADGDMARALGAAFDAGLHTELNVSPIVIAVEMAQGASTTLPTSFDALLAHVALYDLLAARLELACDDLSGPDATRARLVLGQLLAGPLASAERATEVWIDAVADDPASDAAKAVLREHASTTGDFIPLVEALIRVAESTAGEVARVTGLRELLVLADQRLSNPSLALWAARKLLDLDPGNGELRDAVARLADRSKPQEDALDAARVQLAAEGDAPELAHLKEAATALEGRPDRIEEAIRVLREIIALEPEGRPARVSLTRLLKRAKQWEELERLWRADIEGLAPAALVERARLGLAWLARRRGDFDRAQVELEPLLEATTVSRRGWGALLAIASKNGAPRIEAAALVRIGDGLAPAVQATLSSVAASILLAEGETQAARRAAERACHADSSLARPIWVLAHAVMNECDRVTAMALERAMGVVVPRAHLCAALAKTYDVLGETEQALAWTQRWLALRPGDPVAASSLLERVTAHGDAARLADSLSWLLAQPQPLKEMASLMSAAICRLAELDPAKGAALARRGLDVFGPRVPELRDAVLAVADTVGERTLATAVLERQLATGAPGEDRAHMILDLARRRRHAGEADAAAHTLVRALAEGADPAEVLAEVDVALPPTGSDGELALLESRAEALSGLASAELAGTSLAWRDFGAGLWDLAKDRDGAIRAWERAAALDGENGLARLSRDLVAFAGHEQASARLSELAARRTDRRDRGQLLAAAAGVALDGGRRVDALRLARDALIADPSRTDVLAIAERAAGPEDIDALEETYRVAAAGALGIYGERAAHYRAARQLERRGHRDRAFRYSVKAFEAVPAEGVTFVLMMRLAERTGSSTAAVEAIERIAASAKGAFERSLWLKRAALVAGTGEEGKRQKVDVLLRALEATPEAETLGALGAAVVDLVAIVPDEKAITEMRFDRAVEAMLPRLDGPDGARTAVQAAGTSLRAFDSAEMASIALMRAFETDASIDEYRALIEHVGVLARDPAIGLDVLRRITAQVEQPYSNVGAGLEDFAIALADALGEPRAQAALALGAARRDPSEPELLDRAQRLVAESGDAELAAALRSVVPPERRVRQLIDAARSATDDPAGAVASLEEALTVDGIEEALRTEAVSALRKLYASLDRSGPLRNLLAAELSRAPDDDPGRRDLVVELAAVYVSDRDAERARSLLTSALEADPDDRDLIQEALRHARQLDDVSWQADSLGRLVDFETDDAARLPMLRRLAGLLVDEDDEVGALTRYQQILALDPKDTAALGALERNAERRGDWEKLVDLVARRADAASTGDESRRLRIHRAKLLDARLGRLHDARAELETLLTEAGEDVDVLVSLADLNERLAAKLRAAPLWARASAAATDRGEAGNFARRACRAFLEGDDVESARRMLGELGGFPRTPELIALRVDVERRSENPRGLAEALEELALSSMDPPAARASMLVEAARNALAADDLEMALSQAQRAARIGNDSPEPQLFARLLEYRKRGAGSASDARVTIDSLRGIARGLGDDQRELWAFLLAEALDVVGAEGEGMRELSQAHAETGPVPLVALGMAERLARGPAPERALSLFDAALGGDLRGVRGHGAVALAAARAAERAGETDRALSYLEVASSRPATRAEALGIQAELRSNLGRISEAPSFNTEVRRGLDRSSQRPTMELPPDPEMLVAPAGEVPLPGERRSPSGTLVVDFEALDAARRATAPGTPTGQRSHTPSAGTPVSRPPERVRSEPPAPPVAQPPPPPVRRASERPIPLSVPAAPATARGVGTPRSVPPAPGSLRASAPPKPARYHVSGLPPEVVSAPPPPVVSQPVQEQLARTADLVRSSMPPSFQPATHDEGALLTALSRGSVEAGKELIQQLENRADRTIDLVNVCRRVSLLLPGDPWVLGKLHEATVADRNHSYARAVLHVVRAFDPTAEPVPPPSLKDQPEQPERLHSMLFRDTSGPGVEALGLVWQGAQHMFKKDPSSYGVTGIERMPTRSPTPLGEVYGAASRLLDLSRTPLFQRRGSEEIAVHVALLSPPAILVDGDVSEATATVAFHLGAMLAATLPQHVLLYGSPEAQVREVLRAVLAAFGTAQASRESITSIATLAEMLWESIPARSQRRLKELCATPEQIDYDVAVACARQAVRRLGFFVCGDLAVAVEETCADLGISVDPLRAPGGLATLCTSSPAIADLVRLATSPEYANARWQPGRGRRP